MTLPVIHHILADYSVIVRDQHTAPPVYQYTGSYTEDAGGDGLCMNAYNHDDVDVAFDPWSANRRFPSTDDLGR